MSDSPAPQICPHGLRPGTTVCLHCRHEARAAARRRRYVLATRLGLAVLAVVALGALAIGGLSSLASRRAASDSANALADVPVATPSPVSADAVTGARSATRTPAPVTAASGLAPIIAEGRRDLGEGMYAERSGREVTVHFDTETLRTRFDWKFEGVVRATLPLVFGDTVKQTLDSIPSGTLVRGGNLLTDLPTRGFTLRIAGTDDLRVWPITRAGRDGPLVVGYRVSGS